ncbi:delta-lactam-biosynthetic de-N-acetylase [Pelotomaculum propionicicum]|uniref:delta-lactam-biosynthetic de-N-acetylase n=1 Tax=Pelotomaculum propionicicum TaxID=258475 RepID=UPI003B79558A
MTKSKKKKLKRQNLLLGIITVVFLIGITGYIVKAQLYNPGRNALVDVQQEQVSESPNNAGPAAGNTDQAGTAGQDEKPVAPGGSSGQESPVFGGDASNDRHGWGFKRNNSHLQPEMPSSLSSMLSRNGAYWIGSPDAKVVYLTFDEGYENGYTASILDTLKANNVQAAFFVTGHYLDSQPDLVRRMVDEGHIVGNHTDTHPSLPDISDAQIKKELQVVEEKYEKVTGRSDLKYMRPPQGEFSERTLAVTRALGYHSIFWSMASVDWVPMAGGPQEAYQSVIDNTHNGALILLHAVSKDNTEAMDRILKGIKAQGYTFGSLDDLVQ